MPQQTITIDMSTYDASSTDPSPIDPNPWPQYYCKVKPVMGPTTVNGSNGTVTLTFEFTNLPSIADSAVLTQFVYREKDTTGDWIVAGNNASGNAEFWLSGDNGVKDKADDNKSYNYVLYVDLTKDGTIVDTTAVDPEIDNEGES